MGSYKTAFFAGISGFVELSSLVKEDQLQCRALGNWDVSALIGHSLRAVSAAKSYAFFGDAPISIATPEEYYLKAICDLPENEYIARTLAIKERGISAGLSLGNELAAEIKSATDEAVSFLQQANDKDLIKSPFGVMYLETYVPTRTFELALHSLDLARFLEVAPPKVLSEAISTSWDLAGRIAKGHSKSAELLLFFAGRDNIAKPALF